MLFMNEFSFYTVPPSCGSQRLEDRSGPCLSRTPTGAAACASAVIRAGASSTPIELRPSVSSSEQLRAHPSGRRDDADAPRDSASLASTARTSRVAAAAYIGISPSLFDIMVKDG